MNWPKEWHTEALKEACEFTHKPKNIQYSDFAHIPFVPMENVLIGHTFISEYISKPSNSVGSGSYFEDGDILFSKITPCFENGKQVIARDLPGPFGVASTELVPLRGKKNRMDTLFLHYLLLAPEFRSQIAQKMEGATGRQRIPLSVLKEWTIALPPLPEQKRIAAILFRIQKAIALQEEIIERTRELKKSAMQFIFTRGLRGEKTKETEIGKMPESWGVAIIGKHVENPQYGFTESALEENVGPKFLRITDITEDGVNWNSVPYCQCSSREFAQYELLDNDILFARIGATTGKSYIVKNAPKAVFASYLIRLRPLASVFPDFLYYFFNSFEYWEQINADKDNNLKGGVNGSVLARLLFPLPDKQEQKEIAHVLMTIDRKLKLHITKKSVLQDLLKTTLNKLMSGEIKVKDLEIDDIEITITGGTEHD